MQNYQSNKDAYDHLAWGIFFLILSVIMLCSCGNTSSSNDSMKPSKVVYDTSSNILAYYLPPDQSKVAYGPLVRIVIDSTLWKQVDSVTIKKQPGKDSLYYSLIPSYRDTSGNLVYLDSAKGRVFVMWYWKIEKQFVKNGWENGDSAIRYLSRFAGPVKK
jgi:hypothetical protein